MALPFFRALDPTSEHSGIVYWLAVNNNTCKGKEMRDLTVSERIVDTFRYDLDFLSGLAATYDILIGDHYDLNLTGENYDKGGKKGALDYLIFPLVARKLIADSFSEGERGVLTKILALAVAVPLEIARFVAAFALMLVLVPVVALVHLVKACLPQQEIREHTHSI